MNSSGFTRGLAVTAVAALATTGLATSASAVSITETQGANQVALLSQYSGVASPRNDGVNATVHLLAGGGANVAQVRFEYVVNGAATLINLASKANGVFSAEWTPTAALLGQTVQLRATGVSSVGTDLQSATSQVRLDANATSVDIANAAGSTVGTFVQPYTTENHAAVLSIISGTTSGAPVTLRNVTPGAAVAPARAATVSGGTFKGVVDLTGYAFDTTAPLVDEAVVGAAAQSDDTEVVNLRRQSIGSAAGAPETAQTPAGSTGAAIVTVLDTTSAPVAGAQVVAEAGGAIAYTNENGQARFANLAGSDGGTTYNFYVNTDDEDGFQTTKDFRTSATIRTYTPVITTLTSASNDGAAFDANEYADGDVAGTVRDQNGAPVANVPVTYEIDVAPFPTTPATPAPATRTGIAITGADGRAVVPLAPQLLAGTYTVRTYLNRDGVPGQGSTDLAATPLVVKSGESTLRFTSGTGADGSRTAVNPAAGNATYEAALLLQDGTPLQGRSVQFTFTQAAGGNVVVASAANQPSGTTRTSDTQATDVTDANGVVSVALSDPASPDQAELNGSLNARTTAGTNDNDNPGESTSDANSTGDLDVDFAVSTPPAGSTIVIGAQAGDDSAAPGNAAEVVGKPGVATSAQRIVVTQPPAAAGGNRTPVPGLAVTLTVDRGFFTDNTPDPTPAAGADAGELRSLGTTITVVTNGNGVATFRTAIERDAGFDDDGQVTANVTARAGTVSDTEDYEWSSAAPLNGGAVQLTLSPASVQDSAIAPRGQVGDDGIFLDVFTTDQFGNRVGNVVVDVANSLGGASSSRTATSDFAADGDIRVDSSAAGDDTVTATWTAATSRYTAANGVVNPAPVAGTETLTDTEAISFYAINYTASTYSLTHTGGATQPVGATVTQTYRALDQLGQPINGLDVQFFRTGPDDLQDGEGNTRGTTDNDQPVVYVYQGAKAGTATVTTVVRLNGQILPVAQRSDSVTFAVPTTPPTTPTTPTTPTVPVTPVTPSTIVLKLKGASKGNRDVVKVNAPDAAQGATVTLFKKVDGKQTKVGTKTLNAKGNKTFTTGDTNGSATTRYTARVSATAATLAQRFGFNLR